MTVESTPLRRSRRGQGPIVVPFDSSPKNASTAELGSLIYTCPSRREDFSDTELHVLDLDQIDLGTLETQFFSHITLSSRPLPRARTSGRGKRKLESNEQVLNVGDTILVHTSPRIPSVGVLVAIWRTAGHRMSEDQETKVMVHWFLRPSELPRIRADHDAAENEIYYSLTSTGVLPVSSLTGRCTVSSSPPEEEESDEAPSTSTKSKTLSAALVANEDSKFYCRCAIDQRRGLYYNFNWDVLHAQALSSEAKFGDPDPWNLHVHEIEPMTPRKKDRTGLVYEDSEAEDSEEDELLLKSPTPRGRRIVKGGDGERQSRTMTPRSRKVVNVSSDEEDSEAIPETPSRRRRKRKADEDDEEESAPVTPSRRRAKRARVTSDEEEELSAPLAVTATPSGKRGRQPKTATQDEDFVAEVAQTVTPSRRGRRRVDESSVERTPRTPSRRGRARKVEEDEGSSSDENVPVTPSRRRKRLVTATPRKRRISIANIAAPTPHSKAALRARAGRKKALAVRPPPPDRVGDLEAMLKNIPKDPWLRAMHVLHVASRPEALPCREEEYARVLRAVEELVEEGSGGCIYISGVPGTGKTATVHAVVRELKRMAEQNEGNPFTYVEINGLRIPEPSAAYGLLWESISGHNVAKDGHLKISSKEALRHLTNHFSSSDRLGPGGHACVVLMDELDQLMTNKQDVVYNFFNWPTLAGSRLVVLAVANTMDLPERVMTGRVRSRLGMTRINFQPYTTPQLEKIVHARLQSAKLGLPENAQDVISQDGVKFAAMKVSSISGDARRVLDICRRTVELVQPHSKTARTDDVKQVIKDMQNSPTAAYLRDLSLHERVMLASMLKCIKKEGVDEIKWGEIQRQHILCLNLLIGDDDPSRRPTDEELTMVFDSLLASRALICEDGVAVARKPEDEKRVVLNLEPMEVERVLGEVGGMRWKNALSV
ncbi:hypothetical protein C8Q75DRAFT_763757 [Abortiporus biennis]|nr:hypothetical protein C8Q75DRAFT_763757 [Abortiporus biennis]